MVYDFYSFFVLQSEPFLFKRENYLELRREQNSNLNGRRKRQIQTGPYTGNDRYDGYMMDLLSRVKAYMRGIDFEYEVELVPDGKYGHKSKYSKKWDGMIGEVLRKVSYVALLPIMGSGVTGVSVCPSFSPLLWRTSQ